MTGAKRNMFEEHWTIEKILGFTRDYLVKHRGSHGSLEATAKVVSRNEALLALKHIKEDLKTLKHSSGEINLREVLSRVFSLNLNRDDVYSPFNPPLGFYIESVVDTGALEIQALGRNIVEVVFNVCRFVIKKAYNVEVIDEEYIYALVKKSEKIGKIYFAKARKNREKCLVAKIQKEKLVARYYNEGLLVYITISCPSHVKRRVLPALKRLGDEFSALCTIKPTGFLQKCDRFI